MVPIGDSPRDPFWHGARALRHVALVFSFALTLPGCGNVIYTYRSGGATAKLEEAKEAGAEKSATYEYTLAQEYLNKASSEAAAADYGDAIELAGLADEYAERAVEKAKHRLSKHPQGTPENSVSTEAAPSAAPSEPSATGHGSFSLGTGEK